MGTQTFTYPYSCSETRPRWYVDAARHPQEYTQTHTHFTRALTHACTHDRGTGAPLPWTAGGPLRAGTEQAAVDSILSKTQGQESFHSSREQGDCHSLIHHPRPYTPCSFTDPGGEGNSHQPTFRPPLPPSKAPGYAEQIRNEGSTPRSCVGAQDHEADFSLGPSSSLAWPQKKQPVRHSWPSWAPLWD